MVREIALTINQFKKTSVKWPSQVWTEWMKSHPKTFLFGYSYDPSPWIPPIKMVSAVAEFKLVLMPDIYQELIPPSLPC